MERATWAVGLGALLTLGAWPACVSREHRELRESREAYEACVAEHGEAYSRCKDLSIQLDVASERYEDNARRAWACDPAQQECPTPR
jgi:hypothetical protein